MSFRLIVVFLCLPLLAGRELAAQDRHDSLQQLADKYYKLTALQMSDDGKWLAVSKSYDLNSDTVLFFSSERPDYPLDFRVRVQYLAFLCNDNLLIQNNQHAELFNMKEQTSLFFNSVDQIKAINNNSMFLLHYNTDEQNRLELHDSNGVFLNAVSNVTKFYPCANGCVYAIIEDADDKFSLAILKGKSIERIYSSSQKILNLDSSPGEKGLIIYEQRQNGTSMEVLFLDLPTGAVFPLKDVLSIPIQKGFSEVLKDGDVYYLKLRLDIPKSNASFVDIWYGNDNKLEEKFNPPTKEVYYLWEPKKRIVRQIGNDILTASVCLKNERYFLCYDPYCLQDYTKSNPQFKLYIYDVVQGNFSLLDTIGSDLYISGNGEWALCQKKNEWYLYHIPSGSRELISENGLKNPWFTNNGEAVLFEGEGTLWRFELKSRKLSVLAIYNGYLISLVNGEHNGLNVTSCDVVRNIVNTDKPLVIRLYNPQDNITSYVLRNKGKSEVIVPPTSCNIQFFNYNKTYDWYSWVEENYNKPPFLVFKDAGSKETIVYKSNSEDKSILSLKQEIINYHSSEGIPLKGILYYPLNYNPLDKYPMVVHIYKIQRKKESNKYPVVKYGSPNNDGFNLRLLLENGYFVYFPDIAYGNNGPGLSALDCINHALDALSNNPLIDQNKIGLIGHSHGGYETNFIATHSNRFAAYVSGAGNSDIIRSYFSFNYNFVSPFYWQFETGQYEMGKSFKEDKDLYFQNNPIHYVDQVNAPILLWEGMKDYNIYWEQTMEFYIGLKRNNKKVVALFYPEEGHVLNSEDACKDLDSRVLDWFNYFLKDDESEEWIKK
jgi:dienelactone hydrolase